MAVASSHTSVVVELFRSPYRQAGDCLAVFNGDVVERSLQAEHFRFVWDGARIKSVYSFQVGGFLMPERIFSAEAMVQAA